MEEPPEALQGMATGLPAGWRPPRETVLCGAALCHHGNPATQVPPPFRSSEPPGQKEQPGRLVPLQRGEAAMVIEQAGRWAGERQALAVIRKAGLRPMRGRHSAPPRCGTASFPKKHVSSCGEDKMTRGRQVAAQVGDGPEQGWQPGLPLATQHTTGLPQEHL